ncbi:MAG: sugar ABC transporter ATP-binding protein [Labilithrix sp.]|nr:sugar ABC transporter ATP-binding protein [Labilithrix sp.]
MSTHAASAAPTIPALELSEIDKAFGGVRALRGASLTADTGEILGVCGENGAGKSTLLKILAGVHPAGSYGGVVRVFGEERRFATPRDAEAAGIAIVHQELMLVPELPVAQNLVLGREAAAFGGVFGLVDDDADEARARAMLARFGVDDEIDPRAPAGSLGIGRQQIVEIVRALLLEARVLVLDEPTAALTGREADRLLDWLRDLRAGGATCLYVSHRLDEVMALCDRVVVLRDGRTVGTVQTASSSADEIVTMMVGRSVSAPDRGARARPRSEDEAPMLEVRDLSVPLPRDDAAEAARAYAVEGVSFEAARGEIVGLAGAMGSGRTALLSALFGAARHGSKGRVRVSGADVTLSSPRDAIASGIALVPEDRKGQGLVLGLTVAENLSLTSRGPLLGLVDDEEEELEAQRRIAALGVRGASSAEAVTLSGGNQQKLVLGKWLASPPRVLLLDEPTRGVDVGAREEIYALLERLAADGMTVVVASSDVPELLRLADRILVLARGRIAAERDARATDAAEIVALVTGAL